MQAQLSSVLMDVVSHGFDPASRMSDVYPRGKQTAPTDVVNADDADDEAEDPEDVELAPIPSAGSNDHPCIGTERW